MSPTHADDATAPLPDDGPLQADQQLSTKEIIMSDPTESVAAQETSIIDRGDGDTALLEHDAPEHEPVAPPGLLPSLHPQVGAIPATATEPRRRVGLSVPTMIWGLLLGLVAAGAIVHQVSDVDIDFGVAAPLILLGAGALLVLWGLSGLGRRRA